MAIATGLKVLGIEGLKRFQDLRAEAAEIVSERFFFSASNTSIYEKFGSRGREACREDVGFHLEFLRPVLEFGVVQPMLTYLVWLGDLLAARGIPAEHVAQSLTWLADFFSWRMDGADGAIVADALKAARDAFLAEGLFAREEGLFAREEGLLAHEASAAAPESLEPWPEQSVFEAMLIAGQRWEALALAKRCLDDGRSLVDLEQRLILPCLCRIGKKWQANEVSVAQEHMATAIVQSVMAMGLMHASPPPSIGKSVLLACVEGNQHHVGLNMVADAFQLDGWDVQYLGANMPTASLVTQIVGCKPDLVCLSVSFAHQLRVVKDIIARLKERLGGARPPVILGGRAINQFERLAEAVGADGHCASPIEAVAYGKRAIAR